MVTTAAPNLRSLKSAVAAARAVSIRHEIPAFIFCQAGAWIVEPDRPQRGPHFRVDGSRTVYVDEHGRERSTVIL